MASHIAELQAALKKKRLGHLLVSSEPSMRWLTGEPNLGALLVVPAAGEPVAITSKMERPRIPKGFKAIVVEKDFVRAASRLLRSKERTGYEDSGITVSSFEGLRKKVNTRLVPASKLLMGLRTVKTGEEISKIKKAVRIAVVGMAAAAKALRPGITELELAATAESAMRRAGAEWYAFESIIAAGARAAVAHGAATRSKIKPSDFVVIDIGARYAGYNADITRTFCIRPGTRELKIYKNVLAMRSAAIKKIRPNAAVAAVDRAARDVAAKLGVKDAFTHGTGHGVGVQVHEGPSITAKSKDTLKPGMVFTIEPGLYFAGRGGARVEDMFLLTRKGPVLLTKFPRRLMP